MAKKPMTTSPRPTFRAGSGQMPLLATRPVLPRPVVAKTKPAAATGRRKGY